MDRTQLSKALEENLFQCELVYYREPRKGVFWELLLATWAEDLSEKVDWAAPEDLDAAFRLCRQSRPRYPTPSDVIRALTQIYEQKPKPAPPILRVEKRVRTEGVEKIYLAKWRARRGIETKVDQAGQIEGQISREAEQK